MIAIYFCIKQNKMATTDLQQIKLTFIRQCLQKHGEWLKGVFLQVLTKNQHIKTSELVNSIHFEVNGNDTINKLEFTFLDYGRFFDIAAYAAHKKKNNDWNANINKMLWGINSNSARKKSKRLLNPFYNPGGGKLGADGQKNTKFITKTNKWYARTMYGGFGKLVSALMYGLSDEVLTQLKAELENNTTI
jgi:hypothetical protein